jgi:hypothetical protein
MPKFDVDWSKTYYVQGQVTVEAHSAKEAEDIVYDKLGDFEGTMQYNPDDDYVEAYEHEEDEGI